MKNKGFALGTALAVLICASTFAADINPDATSEPSRTAPKTNPVAELRHRDSAFSLLIEAFRQFQSRLIQNDYENRLRAVENVSDLKTKRRAAVLAKEERDLRLNKLYGQIGNLFTTYDYSRAMDEREAGVVVPSEIDTHTAAEKLKSFVALVPGQDENAPYASAQAQPASTMLLDTRPTP